MEIIENKTDKSDLLTNIDEMLMMEIKHSQDANIISSELRKIIGKHCVKLYRMEHVIKRLSPKARIGSKI